MLAAIFVLVLVVLVVVLVLDAFENEDEEEDEYDRMVNSSGENVIFAVGDRQEPRLR